MSLRLIAAAAALLIAAPLVAQDAGMEPPADAAPADMLPADAVPPMAAAPAGEFHAPFDEVEVYDPVNDVWDPCTVLTVFQGAYGVSCDYEKSIRRDIHVRRPGGQPVGQTAATPVAGPPFKRGDIILATIMGLPNDWRLCVVIRNEVAKSNGYAINCGNDYRALPEWVRKDPKAPQ